MLIFSFLQLKLFVILTAHVKWKWVKNIQATAYNGTSTVHKMKFWPFTLLLTIEILAFKFPLVCCPIREGMCWPHYGNGRQQCLSFSVVQLKGKHCWHPIPLMGVAHAFQLQLIDRSTQHQNFMLPLYPHTPVLQREFRWSGLLE